MKKSVSGFTIVELLIVIVVIAILATISIVAYTGIQTRANASAVLSDLKAAEKAFNAYKQIKGVSDWWMDESTDLTGIENPKIRDIITAQPEFSSFLQKAPTNQGLGISSSWSYDYDGDTYNGCAASTAGANLMLNNVTNTATVTAIDKAIDDGNLSCGKIRMSSTNLVYGID